MIESWERISIELLVLFLFVLVVLLAAFIKIRLSKIQLNQIDSQHNVKLQRTEEMMGQAFDAIPDVIWLKDSSGVFLACNKKFEDLLGATKKEIIGKTDYDFFDADIADSYRENDQNAIAAGKAVVNEEWLTFASDQCTSLFETIKKPMYSDTGAIIGVLGIARDIAEHRNRENELKQADLRLNVALKATKIGVWDWDIKNDVWLATPSYFSMLGYEPVEGPADRSQELEKVYPADREFVLNKIREILSGKSTSYRYEARLRHANGEYHWVGVRCTVTEYEDDKPSRMLGVRIDIDDLKKAQMHVEWLAHHDSLTELSNRVGLQEFFKHETSQQLESPTQMSLLFIDLDRFKNVNDILGHRVGDQLLVAVGKRMLSMIDETSIVARQGGDEFIALLTGADEDEAINKAKEIQAALSQRYHIDNHELIVTPSIGISLYPRHGQDLDTLYKHADAAMYYAKNLGRNRYAIFSEEMQSRVERVMKLENEMYHALEKEEFYLHYQPQISLTDGRVIGAEVLLRWCNPELGEISPNEFISIAEDSGQIIAIGEWVIDKASKQLKEWITQDVPPIKLAINLSAVQFRQPDIASRIEKILHHNAVPANLIELELTESVAMDNPETVIGIVEEFRNLGFSIAIDDFGTGYSSLCYLKRLPITKLKIDQSFVCNMTTDPSDRSIVAAIIALAQNLGMKTIAEGVELETQPRILKELGCDEVQGYFYSRPIPAYEFSHLIAERKPFDMYGG